MAIVYMNLRGALTSGGPTVAAARLAGGFVKAGHKVIYDNPEKAKVALCIIESGKTLRRVKGKKTKVAVRIDGAYFKGYWHGKTPDRKWRDDMNALHAAVKRDVSQVDLMIYQSAFSKALIDAEIAKRDKGFVIINNGVDVNRFKPISHKNDDIVRLFSHGVIRNDYIISGLLEVYEELIKRGHKVEMTIVGSMTGPCQKIYKPYANNKNIKYLGSIPNSKLPAAFVGGAIGIYNRQGSSNDNCVVESLSAGLPCVLPSFGGNAELITSGQEGIVVDSDNWDYGVDYSIRMADAVEKIIPDLAGFKLRTRNHAVKNLSVETMIDKYIKAMGV